MAFDSPEFPLFLVMVLAGWHLPWPGGSWGARKWYLLVASYLFYMSWNPAYGLLLLAPTLVDYQLGRRLGGAVGARRRWWLLVSVGMNLGLLAVFKYGNFAVDTVRWASGRSPGPHHDLLAVALPVGISFFTFESLSYVIDVYRGDRASRSPRDFALFLAFFPHLVAGPIVRPRDFLGQLARTDVPPVVDAEAALARIVTGFVKKLLLADTLGRYVEAVWGVPELWPAGNVLLAVYAYAFQIYFDFSGYTDIALGVAQLFGLRLPENFRRPYLAESPREFWQRWHISLSTWLRDYLYIPLGGNRGGRVRTVRNLFLTMLLGGLWHGAAWHFVLWGGFHGVLLVAQHVVTGKAPRVAGTPWRRRLAQLGTFHLVCLGWVLFRAPSLGAGVEFMSRLVVPGLTLTPLAAAALAVVGLAVMLHRGPAAETFRTRFARRTLWQQGLAYAAAAIVLALLAPGPAPFIYFRF